MTRVWRALGPAFQTPVNGPLSLPIVFKT